MTLTKRLTGSLLVLAVLLGAMLLLRPSGSTLAAWSSEVTVAVPALRTGAVRMDVTPGTPGTPGAATVTMAGDTTGTWRPTTVQVTSSGPALTGAQLAGSRIDYRLAAANGTCPTTGTATYTAAMASGTATSFTVSGTDRQSGARTLCLTFVPSDAVRIAYGSRTFSFTTALDGVSTAPATWTATGSWASTFALPAGPSVNGPTCTTSGTHAILTWTWNRAGLSQDVVRYVVQAQNGSTWRDITTTTTMSAELRPASFSLLSGGTMPMRVVAVLADGTTTIPSTSSPSVSYSSFLGIGSVRCV